MRGAEKRSSTEQERSSKQEMLSGGLMIILVGGL